MDITAINWTEMAQQIRYITEHDTPNFGYPTGKKGQNTPKYIVIHHWGSDKSTFAGTVSWLCNPASEVSAHFVAEAGRVACLEDLSAAAWHAGDRWYNEHSIGIECHPRCSDGDMQTVAVLIAGLWKVYGKLPVIGHKDVVATGCPGRWYGRLAELTAMAEAVYNGGVSDPAPEDEPVGEIQVGSVVKIRPGAQWYGGAEIPDWVMAKRWPVSDISGDRVVLDKGGICSPIHLADLVPASGTMSAPVPAPAPVPATKPTVPQIDVDGKWGRDTTLAVQRKLGMPVQDGVLSNQYRGNLDACILRDAIHMSGWEFVGTVSGIGSDTVRALQRMVGADADGVLGPNAITALQRWLGVKADGVLGPETVRALQQWCRQ